MRRAVASAVDACDRPLEARARAALGVVYRDAGLFDAAAFEFARALVTARMHPGATCSARLTSNLANLHRKRAAVVWVLCELGAQHLAARWRQRAAHEGDEFERARRATCAQAEPFLAAA